MSDYSIAILGGGINGVAIARDAALRGLKVILFEKNDFGSGASGKSSKLVHGGLRYLTSLSFGLVRESLRESARLRANAPHLVKPLPFLYPVYAGDPYPLWMVKLGVTFYDWLKPRGHQNLTQKQLQNLVPELKSEGLQGGCLYTDAVMQDNRIVIETMLSAESAGAKCCNYTEVAKITKDPKGFFLETTAGTVTAKCLVNATGAWSNVTQQELELHSPLKPAPTKGIHLVVAQIHQEHALALTAPQDGRLFFIIPWMGLSLVGTTDTPFKGDPGRVEVEEQDREYLFKALHHYFPNAPSQEIASFAALRPLIGQSREHQIHCSVDGVVTLLGGKYTTHRQIAEEVVDRIVDFLKVPALPCSTHHAPLYGAEPQMPPGRLYEQYGAAAEHILEYIKRDPKQGEQICPHHPHLFAELSYAIEKEKAHCPEDWFQRRTSIAYGPCGGKYCQKIVKEVFHELSLPC